MKKIIELDLTGCKRLRDLHERIRVAFDFPDWYGRNWDAFWDLLWSECDAEEVVIRGEHTLPPEFAKHLAIMHEVLDDNITFCKEHHYPPFSYRIVD